MQMTGSGNSHSGLLNQPAAIARSAKIVQAKSHSKSGNQLMSGGASLVSAPVEGAPDG